MPLFGLNEKDEKTVTQLLFEMDANGNATLDTLFSALRPPRELPKGAERTPKAVIQALNTLCRDIKDDKVSIQFEDDPEARPIRYEESGDIRVDPLTVAANPPYSSFSLFFMKLFHGINSSWFSDALERQKTYEEKKEINEARALRPDRDSDAYRSLAQKFSAKVAEINEGVEASGMLELYNDRKSGMMKYFESAYKLGLNERGKPYSATFGSVYLLGQPLEKFDSDPDKAMDKRRDLADRLFHGKPLTDDEIRTAQKLCDSEPQNATEGKQWRVQMRYGALNAVRDYISTCSRTDNSFLAASMTYEMLHDTIVNDSSMAIITSFHDVSKEELAYINGTNSLCRSVGVGKTAEQFIAGISAGKPYNPEQYEDAVACMMLGRAAGSYMRRDKMQYEGKMELPDEAYDPNFAQRVFAATSITPAQASAEIRKTAEFKSLMKLTPDELFDKMQKNDRGLNESIQGAVNTLVRAAAEQYGVDLSGKKPEDAVAVYRPNTVGKTAEAAQQNIL